NIVDPLRKTKAPLFNNAKMASMLTNLTRTPYDAQPLPINSIKFVKKDSAFQFDVSVPRDADIPGANKELQIDTKAEQGRSGENKEQEDPGQIHLEDRLEDGLEDGPGQVRGGQEQGKQHKQPPPTNKIH